MEDKIELIKNPTILHNLNYAVGECSIDMLRDDLISFGGGGIRLDYLSILLQML